VVQAYAVILQTSELKTNDEQAVKKTRLSSGQISNSEGNVFIFIDSSKATEEVRQHLLSANNAEGDITVVIKPYSDIVTFLSLLSSQAGPQTKVLLDTNSINWGVFDAVKGSQDVQILDTPSVVAASKTIKNEVEMQGIRDSHARDGVALTAFLAWLDDYMASCSVDKPCTLSEYDAAVKLETFRAAMPLYVSPSFDTISSYGSNGSIIHYRPPQEGCALLGHSSLYLLDSGGQYLDGTTDVTRTLYFGPSEFSERTEEAAKLDEMRNAFTYVLKAHIALAVAKFPENTLGYRLVRHKFFDEIWIVS
jgi:Xaa-Pro aminopeptidase